MNLTWSGRSCGSNSWLLVQREIYDELVAWMVALIERRTIGNPFDEAAPQGTVINRAQYEKSLR